MATRSFLDAVGVTDYAKIRNRHYTEVLQGILSEEKIALLIQNFHELMDDDSIDSSSYTIDLDFSGKNSPRHYMEQNRKIPATSHNERGCLVVFVDNTMAEESKRQAEAANQSKSNFLATMSHEIRVRQSLTNLLSNACKYTQTGGATLRAYADDDHMLVFIVEDTGIGIKEEDLEQLLSPLRG